MSAKKKQALNMQKLALLSKRLGKSIKELIGK